MLIVHVNVALVPAGNPVTVVVGEVASVIVTSVFGVLHIPLPTPGVFPANVKSVVSHNVWSDPAADVVGNGSTTQLTLSTLLSHPLPSQFLLDSIIAVPGAAAKLGIVFDHAEKVPPPF